MKLKQRKQTILLGTLVLGLLLVFSAGNAHAVAFSTSTSVIDWSSLTITHDTGGSFTVDQHDGFDWFGTDNSEAYAEAETDLEPYTWDFDSAGGWTDTEAAVILDNASATGWTTADELGETVTAKSDYFDPLFAYAYAGAYHMGTITAIDAGTITISVDYSIVQSLSTNLEFEYAYGWALADLYVENESGSSDSDIFETEYVVFDGDSYKDSFIGTLSVSLYFDAGESGIFDSYVENEAETFSPVPEPGTMLLVGSGLLGLAGFKRKKVKD